MIHSEHACQRFWPGIGKPSNLRLCSMTGCTKLHCIVLGSGRYIDDATAATTQSRKEVDDAVAAAERVRAERDIATTAAGQARAGRDKAVTRTALLSKCLADLQEGAKHLRALEEARRDTMRDLVGCGRVLCERFGAELQVPPAYQEEDPASHAHLYLQLVKEL